MDKFCIFCGKKPQSKNREHIIPQWLINLTGDPNRKVYLGLKWTSPNLEKRKFSFNAFTFPACNDCNEAFSQLEGQAKSIVETILARAPIAESQWNTILDWLDKVRIGLWLAMIYLNKNFRALVPMFYINKRIGAKDRFVIIYEIIDNGSTGLGFAGTDSPLFHYMPSCFILMINDFLFLNTSFDFLFSHRFGFPFPSKVTFRTEGGWWIEMEKGTRILQFPLLENKFKTGGTQLFQPMIPYDFLRTEDGSRVDMLNLYDNPYVRANCMDFDSGRGRIFRRERNRLVKYSTTASPEWLPKQRFPRGVIVHQTGVVAGQLLEQLYCNHTSFDLLSDEDRREREAEIEGALALHGKIMEHFLHQKDRFY